MKRRFATAGTVVLKSTSSQHVALLVTLGLLLGHIPIPAHGFLDTIATAVNELQNYASDLAPYLLRGVKMVRQAENFVDSAIGEDCAYECAYEGYEPVPRQGYVPTSNGCGSFDFIFDDSEESLIHVEKDFISCCQTHDHCYDTCNRIRTTVI